MSCEDKENVHNFVIMDMRNRIELENRCHLEFMNYIEESRNDLSEQIQYWIKHYDEEIERRETEMMNLKSDLEKITDSHAILKETYETRKAEIEDWLEYKRLKKEKEDHIQMEQRAARKIQAWWRSVMFRKKLGPYKKTKAKGKDKKGDKKKKK
ncbi:dynein regulatory complex protein 9 [Leptinotarsa decemlineata]|uniref:dynein regulatory complex protein 9 n=1 Tax=Leptinotarsa decemlineata TaxID=7539 RepID=UPI003D30B194